MQQNFTYLALGDSYTIGETLPLHKSFPYQLVQLLRKKNLVFYAPEIIAKTGWTTDELEEGIKESWLLPHYDFVTLLIGVNNQYRGRDVSIFKMEYEELLKKAIAFANGKTTHVVALSIPDYTVTPFAKKEKKEKLGSEIDIFNNLCKAISIQYKVHYLDVTAFSREAAEDLQLLAVDQLHPSAKEYKRWAQKLAGIITKQIK
jgi:lysophospholipase L1-like esterase